MSAPTLSLPTPDLSPSQLSQGLREHIELALELALETPEDPEQAFLPGESGGATLVRAWLEAGAQLDNRQPLFGEPRNAGFAASLEWMICNLWQDDDYERADEERVELMSEELLVMLLASGWQAPAGERDENSIYAAGQRLDPSRLAGEEQRRALEQQTGQATIKARGAIRL